jgi:hypothetical protein
MIAGEGMCTLADPFDRTDTHMSNDRLSTITLEYVLAFGICVAGSSGDLLVLPE